MNFCCSYENHQKRKMDIFYFVFTAIFIITILVSIYISIVNTAEEKILVWFFAGFLGIGETLLSIIWIDYRTWMLSKSGDGISYRNRFGKIKEIQVINIAKICVNSYAKIRIYRDTGGVFLTRNLSEYPGMYELMLALQDKDSIFEFEDDVTKVRFWDAVKIVGRSYV